MKGQPEADEEVNRDDGRRATAGCGRRAIA
jgi:hypothetical protein